MFSMVMTNGAPHLAVAAPSGSHFRIDHANSLGTGGGWEIMTNFTTMGSMSQISDTPPQGSPARFYRALMMPWSN